MQILNEINIVDTPYLWMIIIAVIIFIFSLFCLFEGGESNDFRILLIGLVGILIAIAMALFSTGYQTPTGKHQYECVIDKNTSIQEIYDKYKVVKQRGDIWVLEDKDD